MCRRKWRRRPRRRMVRPDLTQNRQQAFKPYTNLVLAIIEKHLLQHRLELLFEGMRGTWEWNMVESLSRAAT